MKAHTGPSGFALLLVLWTLVILSAIAFTLAASVGTEVRASQESWNDLQVERLAESGQEIASYLETRALGTPNEDLAGLPVEPLIVGLKYRIVFENDSVDVVLEGENGKFDLASASEEDTAAFFNVWTGEFNRSQEIAASIADWIDTNDDARPFGAESAWYLSRGYRPRNAGLGAADLFLVKSMTPDDFVPAISTSGQTPGIRSSLTRMISSLPTGSAVNPNYALSMVLRSLPGMTQETLSRILEGRQLSIFTSVLDFRNRTGLSADSPLLTHFTFSRGAAPSILTLGRLDNSTAMRSERRTRAQTIEPRRRVPIVVVSMIERSMSSE